MSRHLYGIHDAGPWVNRLAAAGVTAWCVHTVAIGCELAERSGGNFAIPNTTAIVRLNNGYGQGTGTIPTPDKYADFAQRCAGFVAASSGIEYVVIGNEIGLQWEWPTHEPISLSDYLACYRLCYDAIKAVAPHVRIAPQAVAPWNDCTPDAPDWIEQLATMLQRLAGRAQGALDWICLHAYTRGYGLDSFSTGAHMGPPYAYRYSGWETLYEFMAAIPAQLRHLPVIITECNGNGPWPEHDSGWVQAMYAAVDRWNRTPGNQQIAGACLFRWNPDDEQWRLTPGAINDFGKALQWGYAPYDEVQMNSFRVGDTVEAQTTVNIRREPGLQGEVLGQMAKGDKIRVSAICVVDGLTWYMGAGSSASSLTGSASSLTGWAAEKAPSGAVLLAAPGSVDAGAPEATVLAMARQLAPEYGLDERLAVAVIAVESGGRGLVNGLPITRFEPHVFLSEFNRLFRDHFRFGDPTWDGAKHFIADMSNRQWVSFHGKQDAERRALRTAVEIATQAAYNAASYGAGQMMGFNHAACGYESAEAMQAAFISEEAQIRGMFEYMKQSGALQKLQAGDIEGFAEIYNGPANVAHYAALIRQRLGA